MLWTCLGVEVPYDYKPYPIHLVKNLNIDVQLRYHWVQVYTHIEKSSDLCLEVAEHCIWELEKKKKELLTRIIEFDSIQQNRPLTEEEAVQKANVVKDFEDYAKIEEIAWRQRSRTLWIRRGVKNS